MLFSCSDQPKVIQAKATTPNQTGALTENSLPSFKDIPTANAPSTPGTAANASTHQVVVQEVLSTDKYNYLKVEEEGQEFWVAISKQDIAVGETIQYSGGLLKRNFFSREFNRVFETVYLV